MNIYVCENCKVSYNRANSSNVRCNRCLYMDSLPIILKSKESCPICMVDFDSQESKQAVINELPCRHQFHKNCIFEWIVPRQKSTCPMCRYKLPIENNNSSNFLAPRPAQSSVQNRQQNSNAISSSYSFGRTTSHVPRTTEEVATRPYRTISINSSTNGTIWDRATSTTTTSSDHNRSNFVAPRPGLFSIHYREQNSNVISSSFYLGRTTYHWRWTTEEVVTLILSSLSARVLEKFPEDFFPDCNNWW